MTATAAPAVQQTTLGQRIAAVAGEAAQEQIKATGKTEFGGRALSIADVDELLGPLMAKHGVISDYEFRRTPRVLYEQPTRNEGILRIWRVDIDGIIWDAASGEERRRRLHDIGSSPSGAVSFALKRWHRALFKIVEDDDQVEGQQASQQKAKRLDWKTLKCPLCGHVGAVVERRDKTSWWCVPDKGGCNGSIKGEQADAMVTAATGEPPPAASLAAGAPPVPHPLPSVTSAQRAELTALNDALPEDLRLTPEGKKALIAEGFEAAKEALLAREQEASTRGAAQPPLPVGGSS